MNEYGYISTEQAFLIVRFAGTTNLVKLWLIIALALRSFLGVLSNSFYAHLKTVPFSRAWIGSAPE